LSQHLPLVVTVPGLRGHVEDHWQTLLAARLSNVRPVPPLGRDNPSLADRVAALQDAVGQPGGPVIIVAHSAGVLTTVHWAARHPVPVLGALLATPPDLTTPLPPEYPSLDVLGGYGWWPTPMRRLPFPSIVAASSNDTLSDPARVRAMADAWGSRWHDLGPVGHLNPASGYGDWPEAETFIYELITAKASE
jgi:predicted alpha/beta hydrolase family esterase